MQFKKAFGFASTLAILASGTPAPHLAPASAETTVEEKRQLILLGAVFLAATAAEGLVLDLTIHNDIKRRKKFTVTFVNNLRRQILYLNIVICNVDYSLNCIPDIKDTVFFHPTLGKTVSYDVLGFGEGCTFDRIGDGGYQNWAYNVSTGCQVNGGHIAC